MRLASHPLPARDTPADTPALVLWSDALIVDLHAPRRVISSAPYGGGLTQSRYLVNLTVPSNFDGDVDETVRRALTLHQLNEPVTCTLTGVDVTRYETASAVEADVRATVYVTAGLGNLSAPGLTPVAPRRPGTINLFALITADIPDAALVETLQIVTEVKARCLSARNTPEGYRATGTSTDTVTVALLPGPSERYAGAVTPVGRALARACDDALTRALSKISY